VVIEIFPEPLAKKKKEKMMCQVQFIARGIGIVSIRIGSRNSWRVQPSKLQGLNGIVVKKKKRAPLVKFQPDRR